MIFMVVWTCLMCLWLFGGGFLVYRNDPAKPYMIGGVLLPWLCVLILGLFVFGAFAPGSLR